MRSHRNTLGFLGALALFLLAEAVLINLAWWQYNRWQTKQAFVQSIEQEMKKTPLFYENVEEGLVWKAVVLRGTFDDERSLLLANQRYNDRAGWRLFTPLVMGATPHEILVDRGWIEGGLEAPNPQSFVSNKTVEVKGMVRPVPQRKGWLKGPTINLNSQELLFLDPHAFSKKDGVQRADNFTQVFVQAVSSTHPNVLPVLSGVHDGPPHFQYMLTWLSLAILLPMLFIWRLKARAVFAPRT